MRSLSHPSPSAPVTTAELVSQKPLVAPLQRFRFSFWFVALTVLGGVLVELVLKSLPGQPLPGLLLADSLLNAFMSGIISGVLMGATQWLALRRQIPDWLWVFTSTAGYALLMTTLQAWQGWLGTLIQANDLLMTLHEFSPRGAVVASAALATLLAALCAIWLGLFQWLVVRQYARPSWFWVFTPSLAVVLSSTLLGLSRLLAAEQIAVVPLHAGLLAAGVLGAVQATTFCTLRRHLGQLRSHESPRLAIAPRLTHRKTVRQLRQQLKDELNYTWADVDPQDWRRSARYLVGVAADGAVMAIEPADALALSQLPQTPLPQLLDATAEQSKIAPLARFWVTFAPSGRLTVRSWWGIPPWLLGLFWLVVVVAGSAIAAHFGLTLPTLTR